MNPFNQYMEGNFDLGEFYTKLFLQGKVLGGDSTIDDLRKMNETPVCDEFLFRKEKDIIERIGREGQSLKEKEDKGQLPEGTAVNYVREQARLNLPYHFKRFNDM